LKFRTDPATMRGSIAPVVTPFTAAGAVDHDALRGLIRWQLESGATRMPPQGEARRAPSPGAQAGQGRGPWRVVSPRAPWGGLTR
jgi:hypothetical protein